jgi:hypothetical protein
MEINPSPRFRTPFSQKMRVEEKSKEKRRMGVEQKEASGLPIAYSHLQQSLIVSAGLTDDDLFQYIRSSRWFIVLSIVQMVGFFYLLL